MFPGHLSFVWSYPLWSAPSPSIPSAAGHPASAASTASTWSGCAWPSPSSLSVSVRLMTDEEQSLKLPSCQPSGVTVLPRVSAAPPDYSSVVTEEEAEQRNNAAVPQPAEDLSGIMERPLMAFVQEFRFRPPPVYCEVSLVKAAPPKLCSSNCLTIAECCWNYLT